MTMREQARVSGAITLLARSVILSRDGYSVCAAMGRDGMIHAGRLSGLASAWEHRGWTVTLTAA